MFPAVDQTFGRDHPCIVEQDRIGQLVDAISHAHLGAVDEAVLVQFELTDQLSLFDGIGIADEKDVEPLASREVFGDRDQLFADGTGR